MARKGKLIVMMLCLALLLSACNLRTVDQLYCLPRRSDAEQDLQTVIDKAMDELEYSAPTYGENRQVTQKVDLDGDGIEECVVFARDDSEKPLKILIFCQLASGYVLMDTIEGYGFAFDFVYYAQIDGQPGQEIVVGRQVSNEVLRSVSVYRFSNGFSRQLMSGSCARVIVQDFDHDGINSLLLLSAGAGEDSGVLSLYEMEGDTLTRTATATLSQEVHSIRRAQVGGLSDGSSGLYVSGNTDDGILLTQVFTVAPGEIRTLCTTEPMNSVGGYDLLPMDLDADGVTELPGLVSMTAHPGQQRQQYFVSWFTLDAQGKRSEKLVSFMQLTQGWYLTLEEDWLDTLTVVADRHSSTFYSVSAEDPEGQKLMTIYAVTKTESETVSPDKDCILLYESDTVLYTVALEAAAARLGLTEQTIGNYFHMMRTELNTEEN